MRWTQARLNRTVAEWQRRFGLTAWTIDIRFAKHSELSEDNNDLAYGDIKYEPLHRVATIRVLHPKYADSIEPPLPPHDPENVIIHEMLHLVTDPLVRKVGGEQHEQFINLMTATLMDLKANQ